jgi:hypothetical protein
MLPEPLPQRTLVEIASGSLLLGLLLCLNELHLETRSSQLRLRNLQLCLELLNGQSLLRGVDSVDDTGRCAEGGRRHRVGGRWLESHAISRAVGVFSIGLDNPAGAFGGAATAVGSGALGGVAALAMAASLVFADEAAFVGAAETAMGSI